jgi:hypothetical protein
LPRPLRSAEQGAAKASFDREDIQHCSVSGRLLIGLLELSKSTRVSHFMAFRDLFLDIVDEMEDTVLGDLRARGAAYEDSWVHLALKS